jgi:AraC-like DNA-binding protein
MAQPPLPAYRNRHLALVQAYLKRHFTDPDVRLEDVAIYYDLAERTLRESLRANGTCWREELQTLRLDRAEQLLKTTPYRVADVARLAGYQSAPAFAKVFRERFRLSPSQFRCGAGGRSRAGGPTGAAFRARRRAAGEGITSRTGTGLPPGEKAIHDQRLAEAEERISDMDELEDKASVQHDDEEIQWRMAERMRDRPNYWRQMRREFEAWVEENDRPVPSDQFEVAVGQSVFLREKGAGWPL